MWRFISVKAMAVPSNSLGGSFTFSRAKRFAFDNDALNDDLPRGFSTFV
jgi:hypothetical protein